MSTYQDAIRPRQLLFIGIAAAVIILQLLAMDWVVSAQVEHARVREAERMSQAAGSQRTGSAVATASASSDGAQSPAGVSTVSYSPKR